MGRQRLRCTWHRVSRGCAARAGSCQQWGETEPSPAPHAPKHGWFWVQKPGASVYLWPLLFQGRDWAVENTPFPLVEAQLEGCASSGEAFTTEVALQAPCDVLQPKGQAPPLRPLPAWPRGSSSKAKAPGPQLTRSSTVEMPACLSRRLPEIKSNLFL